MVENQSMSDPKTLKEFVLNTNWSSMDLEKLREQDLSFSLSIYSTAETICLIGAFAVIFILSLVGNIAVCCVVYRVKHFQNATYILLANIACTDILITVLNIPLTLVQILLGKWIFGLVMCKIVNFTLKASTYVSAYTMVAIALDKYMCMVYPIRAKWTNLSVQILSIITWLASFLISLPFLLFSTEKKGSSMTLEDSTRCVVLYPPPSVLTEQIMTVFTVVMQFLLPVIVTSLAYGFIICKVYDHYYRPIKTEKQRNRQSSSRLTSQFKLVKMLMIVVIVFTVCWLPLNTYHLIFDFYTGTDITHNSAGYLTCNWLAMSNVCYNPVIYCWMHGAFRRQIGMCCKCLRQQSSKHACKSPRVKVTHL